MNVAQKAMKSEKARPSQIYIFWFVEHFGFDRRNATRIKDPTVSSLIALRKLFENVRSKKSMLADQKTANKYGRSNKT